MATKVHEELAAFGWGRGLTRIGEWRFAQSNRTITHAARVRFPNRLEVAVYRVAAVFAVVVTLAVAFASHGFAQDDPVPPGHSGKLIRVGQLVYNPAHVLAISYEEIPDSVTGNGSKSGTLTVIVSRDGGAPEILKMGGVQAASTWTLLTKNYPDITK